MVIQQKRFLNQRPIRFAGRPLCAAAVFAFVAGCAVGPDYHRPSTPAPAAYKEAGSWKVATPNDAASRGTWWEIFQDPVLNELESQVATSNQSLLQAAANYEQAREIARADRATFFPTLSADGSAERASGRTGSGALATGPARAATTFSASLQASWVPDFWGRIRRLTEADVAAAQASAANLASARLSSESDLATDYIELRIVDEKRRLLENAVGAYRRTLQISQNKYKAGVAARNDVISAQAQLDAARAQVLDVGVQRVQLEHAIAVLIGKAPAEFSLEVQAALTFVVPAIPPQVPSELLERRPDIASAERAVAESNARVGVQTAAYYPDIALAASGGYQGSPLRSLFDAPNRFWSLGSTLSETLLDFGQRRAAVQEARAAYDGSVAGYRQTVLSAFQQVEDNVGGLTILAEEAQIQDSAVTEAADAARIALNEYKAGTVDYTTVVTTQVTELNDRESALSILQNRLNSSVALIEALGGGWTSADLPSSTQVVARRSQDAATTAAAK